MIATNPIIVDLKYSTNKLISVVTCKKHKKNHNSTKLNYISNRENKFIFQNLFYKNILTYLTYL